MGLFLEWFTNPLNPQGRPSGIAGEQRDMSQAEWIKESVGAILTPNNHESILFGLLNLGI